MKVKCPTCNVIMKPYEREETFPEGDILIRLSCPECSMESSVTYYRKKAVEAFEDQDIIDEYNEGQSENLRDSEDILNGFSSCNPLSPAYNVANYIMTKLAVKPDLTFIDEDTIKFRYRTPLAVFRVCINLDENSVIYTFFDGTGLLLNNPLPSDKCGIAYCDFGSVSGLNDLCRALDEVATEFIVQEMREFKHE